MFSSQSDHFRVIREGIAGNRAVNEQVLGSVAILAERLGRLKKMDRIFSGISFSPAVEELVGQQDKVSVG